MTLSKIFDEIIINFCCEAKPANAPKRFETARLTMKSLFGFDDLDYIVCEFLFLIGSFFELEVFFEDELDVFKHANRDDLSYLLGVPADKISSTLDKARELEIIASGGFEECHFRLSQTALKFWTSSEGVFADHFFTTATKGGLPLSEFSVTTNDLAHLLKLLKTDCDFPVNILLYGNAGSGRTTFAYSVAKELGVKVYSVNSHMNEDIENRRFSLSATRTIAQNDANSLILVDEAEYLLDTSGPFEDSFHDKAWLTGFLEKKGPKTIWIVNSIKHLDPAILRRFCFSIHFEPLSKSRRCKVLEGIFKRHKVGALANDVQVPDLCLNYFDVPTASFDMAVRQSKALYKRKKDFCTGLIASLDAYQQLGRYGKKAPPKKHLQDFSLEGVCTKDPVAPLLEGCKRIDDDMKADVDLKYGTATMLFYGPPGTGKSELAKYIAQVLKRECLIKRGSDLLSKYVGATEQNIAKAFKEASDKGAVLVFDEVDSFLFSREMARVSWETTLVNEFLTSLEQCTSFCICTTNYRTNLDFAAMRRFSHKVEFCYARQEQVFALYNKLLAPLCNVSISNDEKMRLEKMKKLTPGDFFTVQRKFNSYFSKVGTHEKFIEALEKEVALKLGTKSIGF